jgi:membrane protease YdiL (CAAX protease family)
MRRNISSYGWALLIYYTLLSVSVTIAMVVSSVLELIPEILASSGYFDEEMVVSVVEESVSNGWGYLVACALGVALIWGWKGTAFFRDMWKDGEPMTAKAFFLILCVFLSGQMAFRVMATVQEMILNQFGLSVLESMEQATAQTNSFSMFLYLGLGAPVVEEIVFRGAILRGLERYGKWFAVLISALLFGVFHGNLIQSPYAFLVGLVLQLIVLLVPPVMSIFEVVYLNAWEYVAVLVLSLVPVIVSEIEKAVRKAVRK